jgi:hypothetical protein
MQASSTPTWRHQPKTTPQQVALSTLEGIRRGQNHGLADRGAEEIWQASGHPAGLAKTMQQNWDQRPL